MQDDLYPLMLRPYQEECIRRTLAAYEQDRYGKETIVLPTGAGKTIIFCQIIQHLSARYGVNTLIIAHRDELLEQAAEKFRLIKPGAVIGKVGAGVHDYGGEVTVASIATISRPEHLRRLKAIGYGLIIVDEAHHCQASSYQAVLGALPDAFVLQMTATPDRLDGKDITDGRPPLYSASIIDMIAQRYLCDLKAVAIRTETSLDGLHTDMGDYNTAELEAAVDTHVRNVRVVEAYQERALGRRAICFAVTVEHAAHLADAFNRAGIPAAMVCGETPLEERKQLYKALREGTIKVLTNVQVLSEGFDEPRVDCVIMARPTQSRALFIQAVGRGLRLAPAKENCLLLDITDNCLKHRLEPQNLQKALGKKIDDEESVLDTLEREARQEQDKRPVVRTLKERRNTDLDINLLVRLDWHEQVNGICTLQVGDDGHRIELVPSAERDGYYSVWAYLAPTFERQRWLADVPLDWAQQYAERRARLILADPQKVKLVDRNAVWRLKPVDPLSKQAALLRRFRIPITPQMTKGEASDLLEQRFAGQERRKAERGTRKPDVQMKRGA